MTRPNVASGIQGVTPRAVDVARRDLRELKQAFSGLRAEGWNAQIRRLFCAETPKSKNGFENFNPKGRKNKPTETAGGGGGNGNKSGKDGKNKSEGESSKSQTAVRRCRLTSA